MLCYVNIMIFHLDNKTRYCLAEIKTTDNLRTEEMLNLHCTKFLTEAKNFLLIWIRNDSLTFWESRTKTVCIYLICGTSDEYLK